MHAWNVIKFSLLLKRGLHRFLGRSNGVSQGTVYVACGQENRWCRWSSKIFTGNRLWQYMLGIFSFLSWQQRSFSPSCTEKSSERKGKLAVSLPRWNACDSGVGSGSYKLPVFRILDCFVRIDNLETWLDNLSS